MWEVVVDGSRINGIVVVEQISLLATVLERFEIHWKMCL